MVVAKAQEEFMYDKAARLAEALNIMEMVVRLQQEQAQTILHYGEEMLEQTAGQQEIDIM